MDVRGVRWQQQNKHTRSPHPFQGHLIVGTGVVKHQDTAWLLFSPTPLHTRRHAGQHKRGQKSEEINRRLPRRWASDKPVEHAFVSHSNKRTGPGSCGRRHGQLRPRATHRPCSPPLCCTAHPMRFVHVDAASQRDLPLEATHATLWAPFRVKNAFLIMWRVYPFRAKIFFQPTPATPARRRPRPPSGRSQPPPARP